MFSRRTNWSLASTALWSAVRDVRASGQELFDLTASNPTETGIRADPELLSALANPEGIRYDPQAKGLLEASKAICQYYRESHGVLDPDPERLLLPTSTSKANWYVFRLLCNPAVKVLPAA